MGKEDLFETIAEATKPEGVSLPAVLPDEVKELTVKLSSDKLREVEKTLNQIFYDIMYWEQKVEKIIVNHITDDAGIEEAEDARIEVKKARLKHTKVLDAKREDVQAIMKEFTMEDKLWLKVTQITESKFKAVEESAKQKATFVERYVAQQKEIRTQQRMLEVSKYATGEINRVNIEHMDEVTFDSFLTGLKTAQDNKIKEDARIEAERIEKEKENEILKATLEAERVEREQAEAKIKATEKAKQDKIKEKLRKEREEKEKLQAEIDAKEREEKRIADEKIKADKIAKAEADKLAKAPVKKQLKDWVNNFTLPVSTIKHEKKDSIVEKFTAFKAWANKEIDSI